MSEWGAEREMSALEALTWRIEAEPRLRSTITVVEVLDRVPDWDRLMAAIEWGTRVVPRFQQRVVEPALGLGNPAWVVDPDFRLERHVRLVRLPAPGTRDQLIALAQEVGSEPFDREHPPWEAVLVDGLAGGAAGFILKLHHSSTDGLGGMQLLGLLHSTSREPMADKPQPPMPEPESTDRVRLLVEQAAHRATEAPGKAWSRAGRATSLLLRGLRDPSRAASEVVHLTRSLGRVLGPPAAAPSPALQGRSADWRFDAMDVPLVDLKAAAKRAGGSVNDAFLAALLGGFRRYHEAVGQPVDAMPIAIPISLRTGDHPLGGNQFAGARFSAPVGEPDPVQRIAKVREFVLTARDEPALDALGVLAPALSNVPVALLTKIMLPLLQGNDLQASNVPGIAHPIYLAGAQITHLYPFGPLPGCAAMITLVSHNGTCCIGVNADPAAITDGDLFMTCLRAGFDEVLTLKGTNQHMQPHESTHVQERASR